LVRAKDYNTNCGADNAFETMLQTCYGPVLQPFLQATQTMNTQTMGILDQPWSKR